MLRPLLGVASGKVAMMRPGCWVTSFESGTSVDLSFGTTGIVKQDVSAESRLSGFTSLVPGYDCVKTGSKIVAR